MKAKGTYLVPTRRAVYWVNQTASKYPPAIAEKARDLIANDVGTLEAGKLADIVAVKGNVLNNIAATEKPVFVMKRGLVVVQP